MVESVRSFWKGHLRLSLVTIPVRLVSATKSDGAVTFHQIDRKTNQRVRYKKMAGDREVGREDIVSGYEVEPGNYVLVEPEELDKLKIDTRQTIELTQFVDACEIDPLYFDRPYYILPDGDVAEEGYRIIRQSLIDERKVGIGQLTLRGKENLIALKPSGAGMLVETLRYEAEVKEADDVFANLGHDKLNADLIDMAKSLIKQKAAPFDASKYKNHYVQALRDLIDERLKKGDAVGVDDRGTDAKPKVIDFMEALRKSVAQSTASPAPEKAKPAPKKATAKRAAAKAASSVNKRSAAR